VRAGAWHIVAETRLVCFTSSLSARFPRCFYVLFCPPFFLAPLAATQALYDPKPLADIVPMQGEWKGALTYNDYSAPGKLLTPPTRLFVALSAPNEVTLHYAFNDGPGKTVYSYEVAL
jgi:hypothetical protein